MIYVDVEVIIEKVLGCILNNNDLYIEAYKKYKDCLYAYEVVCCYDD